MVGVIIWTCVFYISNAISITLLGDRNLISGNIFTPKGLITLITNYRVILSLSFAVMSRFSFVMTNNALLKIPKLAQSSTTITTFLTSLGIIVVLISNMIFLKEKLNLLQYLGAAMMFLGAILMVR